LTWNRHTTPAHTLLVRTGHEASPTFKQKLEKCISYLDCYLSVTILSSEAEICILKGSPHLCHTTPARRSRR
jgi:hypothetical protein